VSARATLPPITSGEKIDQTAAVSIEVTFSDDASSVLAEAKSSLAREPVPHNLMLTLLTARASHPEPGRYWLVRSNGAVAGVIFQSPLTYFAVLTPMSGPIVEEAVNAIAGASIALPGVVGDAATAARFAGQWTERNKSAAVPIQGQRLYELTGPCSPRAVPGAMRIATTDDRVRVLEWIERFQIDVGEKPIISEAFVDRRIAAGHFYFWIDGEPTSMLAYSEPVESVVRMQYVWTPPELRNRGYAEACVGALSNQLRATGFRCILYTDLGNPISNSIYRRLGYSAVSEGLRYRFDSPSLRTTERAAQ
jgi:uncharacterized protein